MWASLMAQTVKNLPAVQEMWVGKIPWRRERPCTPGFLPGEFHEQKNLEGFYPLSCKELDMTEK